MNRVYPQKEDPLIALAQCLHTLVKKKSFAHARQEPRVAFTVSIEVRAANGAVFRGIARDLSTRGLGAIVFADLPVGDFVVIKYAHPHRQGDIQIVRRYARIRDRYGSRYGFEFEQSMECPMSYAERTAAAVGE